MSPRGSWLLLAMALGCGPREEPPSTPCWETVDAYEHSGAEGVQALGLAVGAGGELFAVGARPRLSREWVVRSGGGATWSNFSVGAGYAYAALAAPSGLMLAGTDPDGPAGRKWLVRRSESGGWAEDDAFQLGAGLAAVPLALATDASGALFAAGHAYGSPWPQPAGGEGIWWVVRRKQKGAAAWTTVDQHRCAKGGYATAYAILSTPMGLFSGGACGYGADSYEQRQHRWQVRASVDQGATWKTADELGADGNAWVFDLLERDGVLYAAGTVETAGAARWVVRRSLDGGASWATADDFQLVEGLGSSATRLTADGRGNIYAVGYGTVRGLLHGWLVRRSTDRGETWTTHDEFFLEPNYPAAALSAATTAEGRVYVGGWASDRTSKREKMIIRRLDVDPL